MNAAFNRKTVFDTVRKMLGRGFSQSEVDRLDHALNGAELTPLDGVPCVPSRRILRAVSPAGIALIKRFEGCGRLRQDGLVEAYPDPATGGAPWTIGWGATGGDIGPDTIWSQEQCDARLDHDLARFADAVSREIGDVPTSQPQFDALVSFHYNTGAIARATLTMKHKSGDFAGAAAEFQRWNKAAGQVMKGLTRRRLAEAQLYSSAAV